MSKYERAVGNSRSTKRKLTKEEKQRQSKRTDKEYIANLEKQYDDIIGRCCNSNDVEDLRELLYFKTRLPKYQPYPSDENETPFGNNEMDGTHDKNGEEIRTVVESESGSDDELRELEYQIDVRVLESTKKTILRQNYLRIRNMDVLTPRLKACDNEVKLGAVMFLLSHIATQNAMSVARLRHLLSSFIFNLNYKKRGLILCGPSDSGKTFSANLLLNNFLPHEIGYFNCPTGLSPSAFMLQSLSNAIVYRCDEMVFEHLGVIQQMKQLLEGSKTLTTDVMYKDSLAIDPRPTLITMNSSSKYDILKWHPSEYQAFENRCTILWFRCPLTNIFTHEELVAVSGCSDELLYLLSLSKTTREINEIDVLDKFKEYIL